MADTGIVTAGADVAAHEAAIVKQGKVPGRGFWGAIKAAPWSAKLSIFWLSFIIFAAVYAKLNNWFDYSLPLIQDPYYQGNLFGTTRPTESPSKAHWLGTDVLARDTWSRILNGAWVSLVVALASAAFGIVIGGLLGSFVGYVKGRWETSIMAGMDVILAFPALVLLLALVSIWEVRSLAVISLVIGVLSIPAYTRIARANALAISNREFVQAAQAIGTKKSTILLREIVPNVLPALFAYALVQAGFVVVLEGTLSFLGLSVQLPEPTWGNMINEARRDIRQTIMPVFWPSLFLTLTVLSLNQVGDWLQQRAAVRSSAL
ncbi:MAG: ABC transporter permease [Acidimicrobiia bacterium]|nr:ABC transporter permease [Acidimicrobiia bacterium]